MRNAIRGPIVDQAIHRALAAPSSAAAGWRSPVVLWLAGIALLVFAMIVVGGATRLTDSGLSITEWQPILGAIPPLSQADWEAAFAKYREIPEYRYVNRGMSLEAFKFIFWWEWAHRFLGRIIGIAFAVPLAVFWLRGLIPPGYHVRLLAILALGGLQGGIGWYMVQSGLSERIDVSHYRLTLHLSVAFLILGLVVWTMLDIARGRRIAAGGAQWWMAAGLLALVFAQVALGGLVAGTKAGLSYNTWPLMDGAFVPDGVLSLTPWYVNVTENPATMQFNHRLVAYVIMLLVGVHALLLIRSPSPAAGVAASATVLLAAVLAQAAIGIATLLTADGAIPIFWGLLHQGGGAVVLAIAVWHLHGLSRPAA